MFTSKLYYKLLEMETFNSDSFPFGLKKVTQIKKGGGNNSYLQVIRLQTHKIQRNHQQIILE